MPLETITDVVAAAESNGSLPPVSNTQAPTVFGRFFFVVNSMERIIVHRGAQFNGSFQTFNQFIVYRSSDAGVTWFANGRATSPHVVTGGFPPQPIDFTVSWDGANTLYIAYSALNSNGDNQGFWYVTYDLATDTFGSPVDPAHYYGGEFSSCWRTHDSTWCVISSGINPISGDNEVWLTRINAAGSILATGTINVTSAGIGQAANPGRIEEGNASSGFVHLCSYEPTGTGHGFLLAFQSLNASNALSAAQAICQVDSTLLVSGVSNPNHDLCYDPATNKIRILYSNYAGEYIATGPAPDELKLRVLAGTSAASVSLSLEGTVQSIGNPATDFIGEFTIGFIAASPILGIFWNLVADPPNHVTWQSLNFAAGVQLCGIAGNEFNFSPKPLDNAGNYAFAWFQKYYLQGRLVAPAFTRFPRYVKRFNQVGN